MECLLHYTWKHKLFPLKELVVTDGAVLEVIDVGLSNMDSGPDFFNAKLKINQTVWVGNVEIHERASDWFVHKHDADPAYDSVILHVVEVDDKPVYRSNGERIPTLVLAPPERIRTHYAELMEIDEYPPCHAVIPKLSKLVVHSFLSALQTERLNQKGKRIEELYERMEYDWERAFFITLARNYGFNTNADAFEVWASHIPLNAVNKHRDDLFQIEAIFFGQAGLLEEDMDDEYYTRLQKEYLYLACKFGLQRMDVSRWKFMRMRPSNFPHIRMAQLAYFYYRGQGLLAELLEAETLEAARKLLATQTSEYWESHHMFGASSPKRTKRISESSANLLVINTLSPFLYTYGKHKGEERLCQRAVSFLEQLKAEDNRIIRMWAQCGVEVGNAADSQALIQLKKVYCDARKCLQCRFGYEYLKRKQ